MPEISIENSVELVNAFIQDELSTIAKPHFGGRGIVIAAGGLRFNINAWVTIRMLRHVGCRLPIECWYLGPKERDDSWAELVADYGVKCVDAFQFRKEHPHDRLHGWELKPYAITWSGFEEVLFLDADNVPICDPTFLFDSPQFQEYGAVFWPDFGRLPRYSDAWKVFGDIEYRDEPEFESGQILIRKSSCWAALQLVHWYMQNSNNFYFKFVLGDKEVFHMAWRKLGLPYCMIPHAIEPLAGVMCQHDFDGKRIFQHRNLRKWTLGLNPETPGFQFETECVEFLGELRDKWRPLSGRTPELSNEDMLGMAALAGRRFVYNRVGYDHRTLVLEENGLISEGAATKEAYWWRKGQILVIASAEGSVTARFYLGPDGVWFGKWEAHERMPVLLVPLG